MGRSLDLKIKIILKGDFCPTECVEQDMEFALLPFLVFAFGLSLPVAVLVHAAIDTARWQKEQAKRSEEESRPPAYFS